MIFKKEIVSNQKQNKFSQYQKNQIIYGEDN